MPTPIQLSRLAALAASCLLAAAACAQAPSGFVTLSASHLTDLAGNPVSNARVTFTPVSATGQPASFRIASSGQAVNQAVSALVVNGAFSLVVADTAVTLPANMCYSVAVVSTATGSNLLGPGYTCVQPTAQATGAAAAANGYWCSSSSASCNFDLYNPSLAALPATAIASMATYATTAGNLGTGTGIPYLTGGAPSTATPSQMVAAIGTEPVDNASAATYAANAANAANATTAANLGNGTGIPYLTAGAPATATAAQIVSAIGSTPVANATAAASATAAATATTAANLGSGTGIPYLTSGAPAPATASQIVAAIGSTPVANATTAANSTGNAATATTASNLGAGTGIPYLTSGSPSTATASQIVAAIGSTPVANATNAATATSATSAATATSATTATTASNLGTGTGIPYLTAGAPATATAAQIVAAIGSTPVAYATNSTGNAATATALAAAPTNCAANQYPTGIAANGNAQGCAAVSQTGPLTVQGGVNFAAEAAGSAANAYVANLPSAVTAYATGMAVNVLISHPSTGPSTLNVGGVGAQPIRLRTPSGLVPVSTEITADIFNFYWDGTFWETTAQPVAPVVGFDAGMCRFTSYANQNSWCSANGATGISGWLNNAAAAATQVNLYSPAGAATFRVGKVTLDPTGSPYALDGVIAVPEGILEDWQMAQIVCDMTLAATQGLCMWMGGPAPHSAQPTLAGAGGGVINGSLISKQFYGTSTSQGTQLAYNATVEAYNAANYGRYAYPYQGVVTSPIPNTSGIFMGGDTTNTIPNDPYTNIATQMLLDNFTVQGFYCGLTLGNGYINWLGPGFHANRNYTQICAPRPTGNSTTAGEFYHLAGMLDQGVWGIYNDKGVLFDCEGCHIDYNGPAYSGCGTTVLAGALNCGAALGGSNTQLVGHGVWIEQPYPYFMISTAAPPSGRGPVVDIEGELVIAGNTFQLTQVEANTPTAGETTYLGTITDGSANNYAGASLLFAGFSNSANNGTFAIVSNTSTSLVVSSSGVSEGPETGPTAVNTAATPSLFYVWDAANNVATTTINTQMTHYFTAPVTDYVNCPANTGVATINIRPLAVQGNYGTPTNGNSGCATLGSESVIGNVKFQSNVNIAGTLTASGAVNFTGSTTINSTPSIDSTGGKVYANGGFRTGSNACIDWSTTTTETGGYGGGIFSISAGELGVFAASTCSPSLANANGLIYSANLPSTSVVDHLAWFSGTGGQLADSGYAIGTTGATIPLNNAANTFSGANTFSAANTFSGNQSFTGTNTFSTSNTFSGTTVFSANPSFTGNPTFSGAPSFTGSSSVNFAASVNSSNKVYALNGVEIASGGCVEASSTTSQTGTGDSWLFRIAAGEWGVGSGSGCGAGSVANATGLIYAANLPTTSTANDLASFSGTQGQIADSGYAIGTTGATIPLNNAANTLSGANTFSGNDSFTGTNTYSNSNTFSGTTVFSANPSFTGNPTFSGAPSFTGSSSVNFAASVNSSNKVYALNGFELANAGCFEASSTTGQTGMGDTWGYRIAAGEWGFSGGSSCPGSAPTVAASNALVALGGVLPGGASPTLTVASGSCVPGTPGAASGLSFVIFTMTTGGAACTLTVTWPTASPGTGWEITNLNDRTTGQSPANFRQILGTTTTTATIAIPATVLTGDTITIDARPY